MQFGYSNMMGSLNFGNLLGDEESATGLNTVEQLTDAIQRFGSVTIPDGDVAMGIVTNNPQTFAWQSGDNSTYIVTLVGGAQSYTGGGQQQWTGAGQSGQYTNTSGGGSGVSFEPQLRQVQQMLNQFPTSQPRLAEDGYWGAKTINRLLEFQAQFGLQQTGHWDGATVARLQAGYSAPQQQQQNNPAPQTQTNTQAPTTSPGTKPPGKPPALSEETKKYLKYGIGALALVAVVAGRK
jgi:hypothetical protein